MRNDICYDSYATHVYVALPRPPLTSLVVNLDSSFSKKAALIFKKLVISAELTVRPSTHLVKFSLI